MFRRRNIFITKKKKDDNTYIGIYLSKKSVSKDDFQVNFRVKNPGFENKYSRKSIEFEPNWGWHILPIFDPTFKCVDENHCLKLEIEVKNYELIAFFPLLTLLSFLNLHPSLKFTIHPSLLHISLLGSILTFLNTFLIPHSRVSLWNLQMELTFRFIA